MSWKIEIAKAKCDLTQPVWWAPNAVLPNGNIIVAGGQIPNADPSKKFELQVKDAFIFNPQTCAVAPLNSLTEFHAGTDAVATRSQVLFFGGSNSTIIEAYTIAIHQISPVGNLITPRSGSAQIELPDGKILITGGYDKTPGSKEILASVEIYDPQTGETTALGAMLHKRAGHTITLLPDGNVLLAGGAGDGIGNAEIFNPREKTFTPVASFLVAARKDHRAIVANDGKVWLIGGTSADDNNPKALEYFDPIDQQFHATEFALSVGREDSAVTYSAELNAIIVVGGQQRGTHEGHKNPPVATVDLVDLTTGKTATATLTQGARDDGAIAILPGKLRDQKIEILVFTGVQEIYDASGATIGKVTPQPEVITIKKR